MNLIKIFYSVFFELIDTTHFYKKNVLSYKFKGFIWIVLFIIYFYFVFIGMFPDIEKITKYNSFPSNIIDLIMRGLALIIWPAAGSLITVLIIDSLYVFFANLGSNEKEKILLKPTSSKIKKNKKKKERKEEKVIEIIGYFADLIEGKQTLESGEIFSTDVFYNPKKHLKYSLREIEKSLIYAKLYLAKDNKALHNACETGFMFLASFDKKKVKDKIETHMSVMLKQLEEVPIPENASTEDVRNVAKRFFDKSKPAPSPKLSKEMSKLQRKRMKQFKTLIKTAR